MSEVYSGVKEIVLTDEELALFYEGKYKIDLLINQYLVILNSKNKVVDKKRMTKDGLVNLKTSNLLSKFFGKIKPKDVIQECYIDGLLNDSNNNSNVVLAKGKAGSGKSLIALHYGFYGLENNLFDKIVVIVNPLVAKNAAKLGFLPGSQTEKLLDSFIGNMLSSKFGGKDSVLELIAKNKLELLPVGDIRGFETNNVCLYLPEAQNMDISLMKLTLQRCGENTKVIIDGDVDAQVDLKDFEDKNNGMKRVSEVFKGQDIYSEVELKTVYRGRISAVADSM